MVKMTIDVVDASPALTTDQGFGSFELAGTARRSHSRVSLLKLAAAPVQRLQQRARGLEFTMLRQQRRVGLSLRGMSSRGLGSLAGAIVGKAAPFEIVNDLELRTSSIA
jgi:hypothetical protein